MSNPFYIATGNPSQGASGLSSVMRTEFTDIQSGFDKLPDYTTAPANGLVVVNSNNTGFTTTQAVVLGGSFTTSGAYNLTLTLSATVDLTLPSSNDTLVGRATTDTLTNKTFDTGGTGNVFKINGTAVSATTGSGSAVLATSPTITSPSLLTPTLGVATATSINGLTISTSTGTLTVANGKTATHNSSTTFAGADGKTVTHNASTTFAGVDGKTLTTTNSVALQSSTGDGNTLDIGDGALLSQSAGNVSVNSGVATTVLSLLNNGGLYLVFCTSSLNSNAACIVACDNSGSGGRFVIIAQGGQGGSPSFSLSSGHLQLTQTGGSWTYAVTYTRINF